MALVFGFITMLSGIVGVPLGSILSTKLKQKYPRADPLICASGLILSAALLGAGMYSANWNIYFAFLMLFVGEVALNLNWSIVADILLVSFRIEPSTYLPASSSSSVSRFLSTSLSTGLYY